MFNLNCLLLLFLKYDNGMTMITVSVQLRGISCIRISHLTLRPRAIWAEQQQQSHQLMLLNVYGTPGINAIILCMNFLNKTNEVDAIIITVTLPMRKQAQEDEVT